MCCLKGFQYSIYYKFALKSNENFFRKEDILARYGGDEFVVILPYVNNFHIEDILKRLVEKINHFYLPTQELGLAKISASIGVAVFPENAHSAKDLFLIADETMYLAKEDGKNCYKIYNKKSQEYFSNKDQHISKLILDVLEFKNIEPYVQPIVSIKDNTIFAYEVLMRIQDTGNNQIITANRFISIAERMGVIQQLDLILLEKVLKYISNIKNTKFFLNLSPKTITSNSDLEKIISLLNHYNYKNLVFEITERETIKDFDSLRNFIFKLKKFGIEFAIDDFGSGFSSYLYIKEIPIDYIKIEGNFIRTMLTNEIDKVFIDSIVKMARILNIKTIAEFVENKMIMEALSYSHIDFVQGNYIQSPFPLREIQK
ncbi:MAG: EAL domain-containing protein [Leptonema sp. (in: bacteria)]